MQAQSNDCVVHSHTGGSQVSVHTVEVLRGRDGRDGRDGVRGPAGPPGDKGDPGTPGPQGERGATGDKGERGLQGETGIVGPRGIVGLKGTTGDKGDHGDPGLPGPQGPTIGGAVYVRWGRTVCPSGQGTELVYSGRAGGSYFNHKGGGANHLCMPDDPEHLQYTSGVQGNSYLYGVEYRPHSQPLQSVLYRNVPCAVCLITTRVTLLMIPAKVNCPTNWTTEYTGYLMTEHHGHHRSTYECVDKDPESVAGLIGGDSNNALLYHVEPQCNGLSCPPYSSEKELTCVVCSR